MRDNDDLAPFSIATGESTNAPDIPQYDTFHLLRERRTLPSATRLYQCKRGATNAPAARCFSGSSDLMIFQFSLGRRESI